MKTIQDIVQIGTMLVLPLPIYSQIILSVTEKTFQLNKLKKSNSQSPLKI